jgi:hypothetical protein
VPQLPRHGARVPVWVEAACVCWRVMACAVPRCAVLRRVKKPRYSCLPDHISRARDACTRVDAPPTTHNPTGSGERQPAARRAAAAGHAGGQGPHGQQPQHDAGAARQHGAAAGAAATRGHAGVEACPAPVFVRLVGPCCQLCVQLLVLHAAAAPACAHAGSLCAACCASRHVTPRHVTSRRVTGQAAARGADGRGPHGARHQQRHQEVRGAHGMAGGAACVAGSRLVASMHAHAPSTSCGGARRRAAVC